MKASISTDPTHVPSCAGLSAASKTHRLQPHEPRSLRSVYVRLAQHVHGCVIVRHCGQLKAITDVGCPSRSTDPAPLNPVLQWRVGMVVAAGTWKDPGMVVVVSGGWWVVDHTPNVIGLGSVMCMCVCVLYVV